MIGKYQKRVSGPFLDCIDILLDVPRVPVQKLSTLSSGEPSSVICTRVEAARQEPSTDRGKRSRVCSSLVDGTSACPRPADCQDHSHAWVALGDGGQV
jgi:predicted ATPase with chaperone activity